MRTNSLLPFTLIYFYESVHSGERERQCNEVVGDALAAAEHQIPIAG
jgi:hypothetical protein